MGVKWSNAVQNTEETYKLEEVENVYELLEIEEGNRASMEDIFEYGEINVDESLIDYLEAFEQNVPDYHDRPPVLKQVSRYCGDYLTNEQLHRATNPERSLSCTKRALRESSVEEYIPDSDIEFVRP